MPNVTRITSNGTFYTANTIDEISYNPSVAFGKNLFRSSQAYNTGFWIPQTTTVVVDNSILGPDGKTFASKIIGDAGVTTRKSIYQSVALRANVKYTFSVYVKTAGFSNVTLWFDGTAPGFLDEGPYYGALDLINIIDGTKTGGQTNPVINVGNGWYRISVSATPRWDMTIPLNLSLGDANGSGTKVGDGFSGVYLWNPQIEIGPVATDPVLTNASGFPVSNVIFKTTNIGNYYAGSYIDEVSQNRNAVNKNLVPYSQNFVSGGGFSSTRATIISNTEIAPDGTFTASTLTADNTVTSSHYLRNNTVYNFISGKEYVYSAYVKAKDFSAAGISNFTDFFMFPGDQAVWNLLTGTLVANSNSNNNVTITPAGNGWYRISMSMVAKGNGTGVMGIQVFTSGPTYATSFTGNNTQGIYVWGVQLEEGKVPTDYVYTNGTTAPVTKFVKRDTANGVSMVTSQFDERNGVLDQVVDSSLVINLDAAKSESYSGSGLTWFDTTPNQNHMTLYNFNATSVSSNLTWDYNSQSFLALGNNLGTTISGVANATVNTPSFSIEIWSRVRSFNTGDFNSNMISGRGSFLLHGHRMGYNPTGGLASATTGSVGFYSIYNAGNISLTSSTTISINTWYQTVITFDDIGKFARFYVNGVLVASQGGAVYTIPPQPAWTQGPSAFTNGQGTTSINGNIGNFMYYNRPLSDSEVSRNYSAIRGRYGI